MDTRKYILNSGKRVARLARIIAKAIDLFIVLIVSLIFYPFGILLAIFYIGISDYLQNGQSVGKKIMGFQVVSLKDGKPCSVKQSIVRNLPIIIPVFFAIIPFWGWIFSIFFTALIIIELYLLFKLDSGHRWGDVMADTTVIGDDPNRVDLQKHKESWFDSSKNMSPCNRTKC
ncbi:MAG: RDD family protein [Bacteriovoracaceae bacterium]|jgi:uncharacterized RDD family membrane protein YckC|nr:RDD family protein [Bacteriovoracaceae bacterium]